MASPVFARNENFKSNTAYHSVQSGYDTPMTLAGVLNRSLITFVTLLAAAGIGWFIAGILPGIVIVAAIAALIVGLVQNFRREPSPALVLTYAGLEGFAIGGISGFFEHQYPGIVSQAVIGTLIVVAVVFGLFRFAGFRATAKATKVFVVATLGYLLFSLVNLGLIVFGVDSDPYGLRGSVLIFGIPLGIFIGAFAVILGSYSLISDFTFVERGIQNQVPQRYSWTAAFGFMVSIVWLYIEILRILGLSRR